MIDITNSAHQLYQGNIFTTFMKNFKTDLFSIAWYYNGDAAHPCYARSISW